MSFTEYQSTAASLEMLDLPTRAIFSTEVPAERWSQIIFVNIV